MTIYSTVTIGGSTITDLKRFKIDKGINESNSSSSFHGELGNVYGRNKDKFNIGDEIVIYADKDINPPTTKIFTGILEELNYNGYGINENLDIYGRDYTARLMDRVVEPEVYNNMTIGSVVQDIVAKYTEDITTGSVELSEYTIGRKVFANISVYDAIDELADLANYHFFVDTEKNLNFKPKSQVSSNQTFNNSNTLNANFTTQRDSMFNQIWVYGDKYLDGFKENFTAGSPVGGSVFTLLYKPSNTIVTVSGVLIQPGGIFEMVMDPSGIKYLVDYDDKQIIFTSGTNCGNNVPGSTNPVTVEYLRQLTVLKAIDDYGSQTQYKKRVKVIVDKTIKDPTAAEELASAELAKFSQPLIEGNIQLMGVMNLIPGQTCVVDFPNHDINNKEYDIVSVKYDFSPETMQTEKILNLKVNRKIADLTDTIKDILLRIKKNESSDIAVPEEITRMQYTTGSFGIKTEWVRVSSGTTTFFADWMGSYVETFNTNDFKSSATADWNTTSNYLRWY